MSNRSARLIYDFEETDLHKKVYLEYSDNGERVYMPFYILKVQDGYNVTQMKFWPSSKVRMDYVDAQRREGGE